MTTPRPIALVTGGSSGIGLEISRLLATNGHDLVLVAQNAERLASAAHELAAQGSVRVVTITKNLAERDAPNDIVRNLDRQGLQIDVLVNNAGFALRGPFAELDLAQQLDMVQVNVTALTQLTGLLLPPMLRRDRGRILNVASTAAFQAGPLMAVYYATKAYVLSLSEALANEVRGSGVTVTAICPGPTQTRFEARAGMQHTRLFRTGVMDARTVAALAYDAMMRGKGLSIAGWRNRLVAFMVRLAPRATAAQIARSLQEVDGPS